MTTVHDCGNGTRMAYVKGSVESVLAMSSDVYAEGGPVPLDEAMHSWFLQSAHALAREGKRVLAVAAKKLT
ncbi:hypothetical protein ABTH75_18875, partial [Acinetobacter baumannii]